MSSTCFISDLHLDSARPAVTRALAEFLSRHTHCTALYILGDLFEAWPGDDDDSAIATEASALLRDYRSSGPRVYIMGGNRDFLLGTRFCDTVGATLLPDPSVILLHGRRTLLMHGDSLCTGDLQYQQFRRTARDRDWQERLLARPLAERRGLAAELRAMSAEATSLKSDDIMDVTPAEVGRVMRYHGAGQLIHGHTHRPARHEHPEGVRWVLGAWEDEARYLESTDEESLLLSLSIG